MDSLMLTITRAATEGGGPEVQIDIPDSARLKVTNEGENIYAGLVVTSWTHD
jgi:hypothetical protein